jgi:aromatic ring hydroxylase
MIKKDGQYRDSIRDGREIGMNGEHVKNVTTLPALAASAAGLGVSA